MKSFYTIVFVIFVTIRLVVAQDIFQKDNNLAADIKYPDKIASSEIYMQLLTKEPSANQSMMTELTESNSIMLAMYFDEYPSADKISQLESTGTKIYPTTWIPPLDNHPRGFMLVRVPVSNLNEVLSYNFVAKVSSAETKLQQNTNEACRLILADSLWSHGYTGTEIKIAILDTGLDTEPANPDLPTNIIKRDYSNYPTSIDNNVENTVSGHGTFTTGIALGRGVLSAGNTGNGGGPYKGSAPGADLVFLKIADDVNASASTAAIIAAIQAAVDTFNANIISMSFGGWYEHHDGSSALEQVVDWAYSKGVAVFLSAGNEGDSKRHYSGTVAANSTTGYIMINVTGAAANSTALFFNLVWADGTERKNLSLSYYNSFYLVQGSTQNSATESSRGTESRYSYMNNYSQTGNRIYYLRVQNPSNTPQTFHIYEVWNDDKVTFNAPDPRYTVGQPSTADHGFSVGAYTSRYEWTTSYDQSVYHFTGYNSQIGSLAFFTSRGPRIDGMIKPNIVAPGTAIISIRDRDVETTASPLWVDNDGVSGGDANYLIGAGTSMSAPFTAGAAALLLEFNPEATPQMIYDAIQNNSTRDSYTGPGINDSAGYGKLNAWAALSDGNLPVELSSFTATNAGSNVKLNWRTETEVNNYGFELERKIVNGEWETITFIDGSGNSNTPRIYSYEDKNLAKGKYCYRLKQIDNSGLFEYSNVVEISILNSMKFELSQNYPNPFNPATSIRFNIPDAGFVKLILYNILGQEVKTLVNEYKEAGEHTINFNAQSLESGVYIYRLESGKSVQVRKMTFLK